MIIIIIIIIFFFYSIGPSTSRKRLNTNSKTGIKSKKIRLSLANIPGFVEIGSSHNRKIVWYYAKNVSNFNSYKSFIRSIEIPLIEKLRSHVNNHTIKFNMKMESTYAIPGTANSSEDRSFKTSARAVFSDTEIDKIVKEKFCSLLAEEDLYTSRGSGFSLEKIDGLLLAVYHYTPMGGSSYL
jgi:hypothetical protein